MYMPANHRAATDLYSGPLSLYMFHNAKLNLYVHAPASTTWCIHHHEGPFSTDTDEGWLVEKENEYSIVLLDLALVSY